MFATLLAVVVALVLGHLVRDAAGSLRNYAWFRRWLRWLDDRCGGSGLGRGPLGNALALPPVLAVVGPLPRLLAEHWLGLPWLLLGIVRSWPSRGPRHLA